MSINVLFSGVSQKTVLSFSSPVSIHSLISFWVREEWYSCFYLLAHLQGEASGFTLSLGLICIDVLSPFGCTLFSEPGGPCAEGRNGTSSSSSAFYSSQSQFSLSCLFLFFIQSLGGTNPMSSNHLPILYQKLICLLIFDWLHSASDQWAP